MSKKTLLFVGLAAVLLVSVVSMMVKNRRRPRPVPNDGTFSVLQGDVDGHPLIAMVDRGLRTTSDIEHLPFYLSVSTPLVNPTSDGLPTREDGYDLNTWEDTIESKLGPSGKIAFLGRVTWNGHRELMYYVSDEQSAAQVLNALAESHSTRPFTFTCERDEKWTKADRWLRQ